MGGESSKSIKVNSERESIIGDIMFGGVERGTGRTFLVAMHDRSAETFNWPN